MIVKTTLTNPGPEDVKRDAIIGFATENFGYGGADQRFLGEFTTLALEQKQGLPVACYIRAGL